MIAEHAIAPQSAARYCRFEQLGPSESGASFVRSDTLNLTVASGAGVTGVKGRFVTPENVGIAGVIVRAEIAQNPQPRASSR